MSQTYQRDDHTVSFWKAKVKAVLIDTVPEKALPTYGIHQSFRTGTGPKQDVHVLLNPDDYPTQQHVVASLNKWIELINVAPQAVSPARRVQTRTAQPATCLPCPKWALISFCAGIGSEEYTFNKVAGCAPTLQMRFENNPSLRAFLAMRDLVNPQGFWQYNRLGILEFLGSDV